MTRSDSFHDLSNHTLQEAMLNNVADEPVVFRKALRSICSPKPDMIPRQVYLKLLSGKFGSLIVAS